MNEVVIKDGFNWDELNFTSQDVKIPRIRIGHGTLEEVMKNPDLGNSVFSDFNNVKLGDGQDPFIFRIVNYRQFISTYVFAGKGANVGVDKPLYIKREISKDNTKVTPYQGIYDQNSNQTTRTREELVYLVFPFVFNPQTQKKEVLSSFHILSLYSTNMSVGREINTYLNTYRQSAINARPWDLAFSLNVVVKKRKVGNTSYLAFGNLKTNRLPEELNTQITPELVQLSSQLLKSLEFESKLTQEGDGEDMPALPDTPVQQQPVPTAPAVAEPEP